MEFAPETTKKTMSKSDTTQSEGREAAALRTPTDLTRDGAVEISSALRRLLADVFALYVKTKNFHWHMSGRHFRDYHLFWTSRPARFSP